MSGIPISGLGSGIDFQVYIDAIIKAEADAISRTTGRQTINANSQKVSFTQVKSTMTSLQASIRDLKIANDLKVKTAISSDSGVFTATANSSALLQSVNVKVNRLANNEVSRLAFESIDTAVHNGADTTITINVRGVDKTVDVPSGTTLSELAGLINSAGIGVTANVYDSGDGTGTPARLSITDNTQGDYEGATDNVVYTAFSSQLDNVGSDPVVADAAVDSEVVINGETITTSSHNIVGIIPGVSIKLISTDPDTQTLTVQEDTGNATQKMNTLVERYNQVVGLVRQMTAYDLGAETQSNIMAGDSTLRNVLTRLQGAFTGEVTTLPDSVEFKSLSSLGFKSVFSSDNPAASGTVEFNTGTFNAALSNNFDDIVKFFEGFTEDGVSYDGWADKLTDVMDSFLRNPDGAITAKLSSLDSELSRLSDEQNDKIRRLTEKEQSLVKKFARLEAQLGSLNSQKSSLDAALNSIALNNQAIANKK